MIKRNDDIIKELLEHQTMLQKQLDTKDVLIDTQNQQIQLLKERAAFLDEHNKQLSEGNGQFIKANDELEEICVKQQALLEGLSKMMN